MDFHQPDIQTYHMLNNKKRRIRETLRNYDGGISLVLPSIYDEIKGKGLPIIREKIPELDYVNRIVVVLNKATKASQFDDFKEFFSDLPQETTILWSDGERVKELTESLKKEENLDVNIPGKGSAVHIGNAYVLAKGDSKVIVTHDCDIVTYSTSIVERLAYPIAIDDKGFCKGSYSRHTKKLYGRVSRLFAAPLLRALKKLDSIEGNKKAMGWLSFMQDFRFILAGEFSMDDELGREVKLPYDWSLEVGTLAEVYKNLSMKRICQSEILSHGYEHKHQEVSPENKEKGLHRMSREVGKSIFRTLARRYGVTFSGDMFRTLKQLYMTEATDLLDRYRCDSGINSLDYDMGEEGRNIITFSKSFDEAAEEYTSHIEHDTSLPSWESVLYADPDFFNKLEKAVEKDNMT